MATETDIVDVTTLVSNLARNIESTNIISINLHEVIQEFIEEESGTVTPLGYRHIRLKPRGFTRRHISQLLLHQQVPESRYLGLRIARDIDHSLANDKSLRKPVFVYVNITLIKERRLISPPPNVPTPSRRSASTEVIQRLAEERRVETTDFEEETQCSFC